MKKAQWNGVRTFLARMIEKYCDKLLKEIEEKHSK